MKKFVEGQIVVTPDMVNNSYPTQGKKAVVLAYSKEKDRYLLEFEDYVAGHAIEYQGKKTKIGMGLWIKGTDMIDSKKYESEE